MPSSITINEAGIRGLLGPTGPVGQYVTRLCLEIAETAKAEAPVKTGHLRDSISPSRRGDVGIVAANTSYALAVHEGAKPHLITPKQATVLRFPSKAGEIVYANRVNHPGNKANQFLVRAMLARVRL